MNLSNLENLALSSDACRHLRPRLCIEMVRSWNETEKRSRAPLTWLGLVDVFNAHAPNPHADEVQKSFKAIMAAATLDHVDEQVAAAFDARSIGELFPSKKAHDAMRTALFEPRMAAGGKPLYELFFQELQLNTAGLIHNGYGNMLCAIEAAVIAWPLGRKLADQIMEAGLHCDGLTLAQLKECTTGKKKTLGDARLETAARHNSKFLFVFPTHRTGHA